MPSAQVSSYTAHVGRLGSLGTDRLLVLAHTLVSAGESGATANSEIYFSDRFGASMHGFNTVGDHDRVRAHLPVDDYGIWLDLLRHESPVYLHWSVAEVPGAPDPDGIVHLATGPEPTGEGPIDFGV
jgi:hypothetical protein